MAKKKTSSVVAKQMAVATASAKRKKRPSVVKTERPVLSAVRSLVAALAEENAVLQRIDLDGGGITITYLKSEKFDL
jgi:hypothetical protein